MRKLEKGEKEMKRMYCLLLLGLLSVTCAVNAQIKTITIANITWMAENVNTVTPGSWTFNGIKENGAKYGRLYTWEAAQKVCPAGWKLPTEDDWAKLAKALGGEEVAGKKLKINGSSGFNAKLAGYSNGGSFWFLESYGGFWTSTGYDKEHAWYIFLTQKENSLTKTYFSKSYGFSVRCIKK